VFAGSFYPAEPAPLAAMVRECLRGDAGREPEQAAAIIVPHAGYIYSGRVAGAVYGAVALSSALIVLCPNHTGEGSTLAVIDRGVWRTPLGDAVVNEPLARRVLETCGGAEVDHRAHRREHSLEVQLPFLQTTLKEFSFVPICVGTARLETLTRLGDDLARVLRTGPERVSLVITSDMSHYIPDDKARVKDMIAVERVEAVDPEGLHRVVESNDISMCGYAPAVAGLTAARANGARTGRLLAYANSGDVTGDNERVVGYAGLVIS